MSGDPAQEYFVDGITEDIISALSHYRWFFVIARNSTFAYKGRPRVDVKQMARELGVRSMRRVASTSGPSASTATWRTSSPCRTRSRRAWSGRSSPRCCWSRGGARKSITNVDAFDCCMRGVWQFHQHSLDDYRQAEAWLRRSIELDPSLAQSHTYLAGTLNSRIWWGWSADIEQDVAVLLPWV
jgi:adenylate cyclase